MIIGTGVDITEVRRIRAAAEKWGEDFLRRVFTRKEIEQAKNKSSFYQHLAGRFAAKEAIFKAAGDNSLSWQDIQVSNDETGKPVCRFLNGKGKNINVCISISHVKTYAVASAVVTEKS
ncbi:MAG: holo-ACP synthase [Candidatus Omnitrophica bacterium]|nr:holo-ACP synthase [Candidatus Omnitrophota bacterium]MDD5771075.1 holo-ACP synthase [Candidatus Omnitrophota bacterium]